MIGAKVINKTAPPEPFEGVETLEEQKFKDRVKSAAAQFVKEHGVDVQHYAPALKEALDLVKDGASIETAIYGKTGLFASTWRSLFPTVMDAFDKAQNEAATAKEIQVGNDKPDIWLRQNFPEKWTPKEKKEVGGKLQVEQLDMDEDAIEVAYLAIQRKKNSGDTEVA